MRPYLHLSQIAHSCDVELVNSLSTLRFALSLKINLGKFVPVTTFCISKDSMRDYLQPVLWLWTIYPYHAGFSKNVLLASDWVFYETCATCHVPLSPLESRFLSNWVHLVQCSSSQTQKVRFQLSKSGKSTKLDFSIKSFASAVIFLNLPKLREIFGSSGLRIRLQLNLNSVSSKYSCCLCTQVLWNIPMHIVFDYSCHPGQLFELCF